MPQPVYVWTCPICLSYILQSSTLFERKKHKLCKQSQKMTEGVAFINDRIMKEYHRKRGKVYFTFIETILFILILETIRSHYLQDVSMNLKIGTRCKYAHTHT